MGIDILLQLRHAGGADDGRGHEPARIAPGQCQLRWRQAVRAGQRRILAGCRYGGRAHVAGTPAGREARQAALGLRIVDVFCRQLAERQRAVGQQADVLAVAGFVEQARLEMARRQVVQVLDGRDTGQAFQLGLLDVFAHAPRRFVRHADVANLAFLDQLAQRGQGILDGDRGVILARVVHAGTEDGQVAAGPEQLIQVDVLRLQPAQAVFDGGADVSRVMVRLALAYPVHARVRPRHLAGQHDVATPAALLQPAANVALRAALRVGAGYHRIQAEWRKNNLVMLRNTSS